MAMTNTDNKYSHSLMYPDVKAYCIALGEKPLIIYVTASSFTP